ncbi:type II secretion system minor pseudopilin GspK [Aeromonas simiae]|uniref:type II secretion system minor pseudopilin GspK n=1 Tax=Aeromonas simiae TaxID=218936 RepID=UPI0018DB5F10|nr:type II secretion system minor pseudopilin GspK [Aeromonas simiae]
MRGARRARGMALLVVMLILAVMVVVATQMSGRLQIELRRTANLSAGKQAWWYAMSAEALVAKALAQDAKDSPEVTHLGQHWARDDATFPLPDGTLSGRVRDLYGCFNLNSLGTPNSSGETGQPYPARAFKQLLLALELDEYESSQITDALRDWIDSDTVISGEGAEDAYYEGLKPAYLPANQPLASVDELRAVRGVTPTLYRKLRPYVCVRGGTDLKVNLNTIGVDQPELLVALSEGSMGLDDAKQVLRNRPKKGWENNEAVVAELAGWSELARNTIILKSDLFEAHMVAEVGDSRAFLTSVLQRGRDNKFTVIRRLQDDGEEWH